MLILASNNHNPQQPAAATKPAAIQTDKRVAKVLTSKYTNYKQESDDDYKW